MTCPPRNACRDGAPHQRSRERCHERARRCWPAPFFLQDTVSFRHRLANGADAVGERRRRDARAGHGQPQRHAGQRQPVSAMACLVAFSPENSTSSVPVRATPPCTSNGCPFKRTAGRSGRRLPAPGRAPVLDCLAGRPGTTRATETGSATIRQSHTRIGRRRGARSGVGVCSSPAPRSHGPDSLPVLPGRESAGAVHRPMTKGELPNGHADGYFVGTSTSSD